MNHLLIGSVLQVGGGGFCDGAVVSEMMTSSRYTLDHGHGVTLEGLRPGRMFMEVIVTFLSKGNFAYKPRKT